MEFQNRIRLLLAIAILSYFLVDSKVQNEHILFERHFWPEPILNRRLGHIASEITDQL